MSLTGCGWVWLGESEWDLVKMAVTGRFETRFDWEWMDLQDFGWHYHSHLPLSFSKRSTVEIFCFPFLKILSKAFLSFFFINFKLSFPLYQTGSWRRRNSQPISAGRGCSIHSDPQRSTGFLWNWRRTSERIFLGRPSNK